MQREKFFIEKIMIEGKTQICLKGIIDEDSDFTEIKKEPGPLHLNLSGITGINSLGIRMWVNFWRELSSTPIFYIECPPVIVRQMSMIPSFSGHAQVVSVYAPYVCNECEFEQQVLVSSSQLESNPPQIPDVIPCSQCKGGEMELDGSPRQYFSFKRG